MRISAAIGTIAVTLGAVGTASAFECPKHFGEADAAIERATRAMNAMPDSTDKGLVHALIDDAKTWLHSGKHNHEKPAAGKFDHARAIAKAQSAIGYAMAAELMAQR